MCEALLVKEIRSKKELGLPIVNGELLLVFLKIKRRSKQIRPCDLNVIPQTLVFFDDRMRPRGLIAIIPFGEKKCANLDKRGPRICPFILLVIFDLLNIPRV
jgi:hypothetical protein